MLQIVKQIIVYSKSIFVSCSICFDKIWLYRNCLHVPKRALHWPHASRPLAKCNKKKEKSPATRASQQAHTSGAALHRHIISGTDPPCTYVNLEPLESIVCTLRYMYDVGDHYPASTRAHQISFLSQQCDTIKAVDIPSCAQFRSKRRPPEWSS